MPRFSIVLIAYNQRAYLPDALRSVREQTLDDWEIVAVDDGSTDGTLDLLREEAAGDPRLRVVALENGGAPGRSRNHGLDHVRGELVSFLDADDLYPRTRLAELDAAFARYPQAQLVFGDLVKFEGAPDARRRGTLAEGGAEAALLGLAADAAGSAAGAGAAGATLLDRRAVLEYAMTTLQPWATLNCVARREAIAAPGLRFDAPLRNGEDFEFFARIAAAGDVVYLPAVVGYYRIHATNITRGPGAPKARNDAVVHERLIAALGHALSPAAQARARRMAATLRFDAGYGFWRDGDPAEARTQYWQSFRLAPSPRTTLAFAKTLVPGFVRHVVSR